MGCRARPLAPSLRRGQAYFGFHLTLEMHMNQEEASRRLLGSKDISVGYMNKERSAICALLNFSFVTTFTCYGEEVAGVD